jgi:hypothetical protein
LQPPDSASIPADFGLFPSIIVTRLSQEGRHNSNNPKDIRVATHLLATEFLIERVKDAPSRGRIHWISGSKPMAMILTYMRYRP